MQGRQGGEGRQGLEQFVVFLSWLVCLWQLRATAAPCFPCLIPRHEFLLAVTGQCAFGWQVYPVCLSNPEIGVGIVVGAKRGHLWGNLCDSY